MEHTRPTQAQRVLAYMEITGGITQMDALRELGVMRLASRISELNKRGHRIGYKWVELENRWGEKCRVKRYYIQD